jgi:hypothetical protein
MTHVWGHEYLDLFLNVCIPNQLAPGNVPALPPGSRYRILTRSVHLDELAAHPMVHALREQIPVDIVVVEALDRDFETARAPYELMNACHKRAIDDILDRDAAIIMLSADIILSNNALAAVVQRHREGYRAVVNTGLRLSKEPFLQGLQESGTPLAALSSRDLVRLAMPYLSQYTESMFAAARPFCRKPVAVYWRVANEGLLARCLCLHPLMVDPVRPVSLTEGTNDGIYVAQACPDVSLVHVVTDSDELQMFELSPARNRPMRGSGGPVWRVAAMAAKCDHLQLSYWEQRDICLHTGEPDEKWAAAASLAQGFADRVMRRRRHARFILRWIRRVERLRKRPGEYFKVWRPERHRIRIKRIRQWGEHQLKVWNRRRPHVTRKQIVRALRLATHRSGKALRKSTQRIRRQVAIR